MNTALELRFLRSVGTKTIVDAIVDALKAEGEAYSLALNRFKSSLLESIGASGLHIGDQIAFLFDDGENLEILVRGTSAGHVGNKDLRRNLLGLYAGEKSIVPEFRKSIIDMARP